MKKTLLLSFLLVSLAFNRFPWKSVAYRSHPPVYWDSTKNWKIYKLQNLSQAFHIPSDSLQYLEAIDLNDDSMHRYLAECTRLKPESPLWMGCFLASYHSPNGHKQKAVISQYAGFFYSDDPKTYFRIPSKMEQQWMDYLSGEYLKLR